MLRDDGRSGSAGALVEPEDGVPAVLRAGRNRYRLPRGVAHHEGAGRVEGDGGDCPWRDARPVARGADRGADRAPDLPAVLVGMVGAGSAERDRLFGATEKAAAKVEDAGARTAGTDIDGGDEGGHGTGLSRR